MTFNTSVILNYNMQNTLYQLSFWQQRWIMDHLPPLSIPTWTSPHYQQYTDYTYQYFHHTYSQPLLSYEPLHQEDHEPFYRYDTESDSDDDYDIQTF